MGGVLVCHLHNHHSIHHNDQVYETNNVKYKLGGFLGVYIASSENDHYYKSDSGSEKII